MSLMTSRRGFSLIEMGVVVGVGAVAAGIAVPVFMNYRYSNDLQIAVSNITQGVGEAKILALNSKNDSAWGYSVANGVVFQGTGYATRNPVADEYFPVPSTVTASGLMELFFSKMDGRVNQSGVILLTGRNGNQVAITIDDFGVATAGEATSSAIAMAGSSAGLSSSSSAGVSSAGSEGSASTGGGSEGSAGSQTSGGVSSQESAASSDGGSAGSVGGTGSSETGSSAGGSESGSGGGTGESSVASTGSEGTASSTGSQESAPGSVSSSSASSVEPPIEWVNTNVGVLLLDPSMEGSLYISGNGDILNISNNQGVVTINSNHAKAAKLSGNGDATAYEFRVTGGTYTSGNGHFVGTVTTGVAPTPDPLLNVVTPTPPTQTYSSVNISGNTHATINPGTYVGGITVSSNATLTMNPGIYYLQGGGLKVSGNGAVSGNGVMVYNAPEISTDNIAISSNGNVTLSAMNTGIYAGMAIFQRRPSPLPLNISGNGVLNVNGIVYMPSAPLTITGNGDLLGVFVNLQCVLNSRFIFKNMSFTGNGEFNVQ